MHLKFYGTPNTPKNTQPSLASPIELESLKGSVLYHNLRQNPKVSIKAMPLQKHREIGTGPSTLLVNLPGAHGERVGRLVKAVDTHMRKSIWESRSLATQVKDADECNEGLPK